MSEKDNISDKELRAQAPLLFTIKKQEIKIPQGYFESLPDKVLERIEEVEELKVAQMEEPKRSNLFVWAIAAGIAAIAGMFIINGSYESNEELVIASDLEINLEEDMEYLLEIDEEIIIESYLAVETSTELNEDIEFLIDEDFEYEDYLNIDL